MSLDSLLEKAEKNYCSHSDRSLPGLNHLGIHSPGENEAYKNHFHDFFLQFVFTVRGRDVLCGGMGFGGQKTEHSPSEKNLKVLMNSKLYKNI